MPPSGDAGGAWEAESRAFRFAGALAGKALEGHSWGCAGVQEGSLLKNNLRYFRGKCKLCGHDKNNKRVIRTRKL